MPSFWGAEFGSVVTGLLDVKLAASPPLRSRIDALMDTAAKSLPASTVLPTLVQLWDSDPSVSSVGSSELCIVVYILCSRRTRCKIFSIYSNAR